MTEAKQYRAKVDDLFVITGRGVVLIGKTESPIPWRLPQNGWLEIDGQRSENVTIVGVERFRPNWDPRNFGVLVSPAPALTREEILQREVWLLCELAATDG